MIHFLEDWNFYPTATYDDQTNNESFLYYTDLLAKMGVENYLWPLSIINPMLKGIDPHDPDVINDPLMCDLIAKENKINFWYYLRNVCRLKGQGSAEPMKFRAHRANMAFSWVTHLNIDVNCTLPRQKGKSVGADATNNHHVNLSGEGLSVQLYTKDNKLRQENVAKLKSMRDLLPPYLNYFNPATDSDNNAEVTCNALGNKYLTAVAQKTEDGAENTGRGLSSPRQQMDEIAYCANACISVPASMGGTTATRRLAMAQGSPYGLMTTTTAGKKDTRDGKFAYDLIHGGIDFTEALYDTKNRAELMEVIRTNRRGKRDIINVTMNHRQLGITDQEFKEDIENAGTDREQTERDYLNKWTQGGVYSPLSTALNNILFNSIREPEYVHRTRYNFMVNYHASKDSVDSILDTEYTIAALDSSNAVGGDGNGLQILNLKTMEQVGTSFVNITSLQTYSMWLADMLVRYPKMTLMVENKSSGQAIMDCIAYVLIGKGIDPFKRIFNRIIHEGNKLCSRFKEVTMASVPTNELYEKYKKFFGFMTTKSTRDYLYNNIFRAAMESCAHLVKDKDTNDQIRALEVRNGRIDHPKGENDDMVIAYNLAHYFAADARNLDVYGIPFNYVKTSVSKNGATMSPEEAKKLREQSMYKARAEALKEEIKKSSGEFDRQVLMLKLQKIISCIEDDSDEWNMDTIRNEMKATKPKIHERMRMYR